MKIAIIRQRYTPFGGAERFVERALGALVEEGASITLIAREWNADGEMQFQKVICDPPYSRLFGGRAARDKAFAKAVQVKILQGQFDITQSHERIPGCMVFRAGDGVHAAWLQHRAKSQGFWGRLGASCSSYHRYILGVEREMFAHPALRSVVCNSKMVADEVHRFYGIDRERLSVIYNGVDTIRFSPEEVHPLRQQTRKIFGIDEHIPVLLFVGSGFERKGIPTLLRAACLMRNRDFRLVIVGADRKLRAMRKLAEQLGLSERVIMTGPFQDVRPWYGAADGFVLPTLYDPCPNAVLEAMACGLPVVTTVTCGAKEWISDSEWGRVVEPLNEQMLAEALDWLVAQTGNVRVAQGARSAVAHLTLDGMAAQMLDLYRRLLEVH